MRTSKREEREREEKETEKEREREDVTLAHASRQEKIKENARLIRFVFLAPKLARTDNFRDLELRVD